MAKDRRTRAELLAENEELRARATEAEQTLQAIQAGEVDAVVVSGPAGDQVYTLRGADRAYKALVEEMGDGAATVSADGLILYANRAFCDMLRATPEEVAGRGIFDLAAPADRGLLEALVARASDMQDSAGLTLACGDGTRLPVHLSLTPVRLDDVLVLCAVMADLSEQRRRQDELEAAVAERTRDLRQQIAERELAETQAREAQEQLLAEQRAARQHAEAELGRLRDALVRTTRLATIGQVSATIAHELRNPLASIRNAVFYLKRKTTDDQPLLQEYLGIIDQEIDKADAIIGNLLSMAKAKAPGKAEVDLAQVLADVLARDPKAARVRCRMSLDPDPFVVSVDPDQLRQVIQNLLDNAADATDGQAELFVEARRDDQTDAITFRDTGPGVAAEVRKTLFEPLVTTRNTGTGLGLTICRLIVERHRGTIDLIDQDAGGAVFRIRLPRPQGG